MRFQKIIFNFLLFVSLVLFDQTLKVLASRYLPYYLNKGIIFGWFSPLAVVFVAIGVLLLVAAIWREQMGWSVILLLAGVVSNIIDRLRYGGVLDYIDVKILPVFNLADVFIMIGLIFTIKNLTGQKKIAR